MDFKKAVYKNNNTSSNTLPEYINITYEQLSGILSTVPIKPIPKSSPDIVDEFFNENELIFYDFYSKGLEKWRDKGFLNHLDYTSFYDLIKKNITVNLKDCESHDSSDDEIISTPQNIE